MNKDRISGLLKFEDFLAEAQYVIRDTDRSFLILAFDISDFHYVNNQFGYDTGDAVIRSTPNDIGYGTGTVINLQIDAVTVKSYTVIIFGDLDGNTRINAADTSILQTEIASPDWSGRGASKVPYLVKAADLDGNRRVNAADLALLKSAAAGDATIDQIYGEVN